MATQYTVINALSFGFISILMLIITLTTIYFMCCLKVDFNVSSSLEAYFDGLHLAICENKLHLAKCKCRQL